MKELLITYSKNNLIIFSSCVALVVLNLTGLMSLSIIAYILLAMLVFDVNVNDKTKGNWSFLESLPITLGERYFLKVIIPFTFLVFVSIGMQNNIDLLFVIDSGLSEILLSASVLIIASLLATKLNKFILYILGFSFTAFLLSFLPFSEIIVSVVYLIASYYIISNKRVQKNKLALLSIIILLPSLLILQFGKAPLYRSLLESKTPSIALFSAGQLIEMNKDKKAINYLTRIITETQNTQNVRNSLEILEDNEVKIIFNKEKWLNLFKVHVDAREDIIDYFIDREVRPDWITHLNLLPFEEIMLDSGNCNDVCHEMANLVSDDSISVNKDRISELLTDNRINRNDYAIRVVIKDGSLDYRLEVIKLLGHPDENIKELALEYLTDITKNDLKQELNVIKKLLKENNSEKNINKAIEFFKSSI
jgi:hypothetical protein